MRASLTGKRPAPVVLKGRGLTTQDVVAVAHGRAKVDITGEEAVLQWLEASQHTSSRRPTRAGPSTAAPLPGAVQELAADLLNVELYGAA